MLLSTPPSWPKYAHLYHSHFNDFVKLDSETHLNDSFRHFIFFVKEFRLLNSSELPPLQQLILFLEQQNEEQERQQQQPAVRIVWDPSCLVLTDCESVMSTLML